MRQNGFVHWNFLVRLSWIIQKVIQPKELNIVSINLNTNAVDVPTIKKLLGYHWIPQGLTYEETSGAAICFYCILALVNNSSDNQRYTTQQNHNDNLNNAAEFIKSAVVPFWSLGIAFAAFTAVTTNLRLDLIDLWISRLIKFCQLNLNRFLTLIGKLIILHRHDFKRLICLHFKIILVKLWH